MWNLYVGKIEGKIPDDQSTLIRFFVVFTFGIKEPPVQQNSAEQTINRSEFVWMRYL